MGGSQGIAKVVFPVAGLGTRFLPATKAIPKEMLPVLDRPLIQYAVDEALAAGADTLIFVTGDKRDILESYFSPAPRLEAALSAGGKDAALARVRAILPESVRCVFVEQPSPKGLGHAILCAREAVGTDTFGVVLPDDLILSEPPGALRRMADTCARENAGAVAVQTVAREQTHRYGIVSVDDRAGRAPAIRALVEKPDPQDAPSDLAIVGRYVLPARIFELLEGTSPGAGGEIQITDAIAELLKEHSMLAYRFQGERFDCGNMQGHFQACLAYARQHPELTDL